MGLGCFNYHFVSASLQSQQPDAEDRLAGFVSEQTQGRLKFSFESRGRYEIRTDGFGQKPDVATGLIRTRLGATYTHGWLRVSGMVQDARAPWYGSSAPSNVRDYADLQEGYVELFPESKTGFGMTAGRMMLNYGEGRVLGTPQWGNVARTYDHARLYYRLPKANLEFLLVSPVKIRVAEFNRPVLGDRMWGMYNSFPGFYRKHLLEIYLLRRDQNRPGGFVGGSPAAGTDKLGINTLGFRLAGPAVLGLQYSIEAAVQNGKVGPASHRAGAFFGSLSRRTTVLRRQLDLSGEYKYASGTRNPADLARSGTFDQLYAANHDKFGHQDLFGWRNLHNFRSLVSFAVTQNFSLHFMYDNFWLASRKDALYNSGGQAIVKSAAGTAGRHVGQETDLFVTYRYKHFLLGGGYGRLLAGEFLRKTSPGVSPSYWYLFHTYTF